METLNLDFQEREITTGNAVVPFVLRSEIIVTDDNTGEVLGQGSIIELDAEKMIVRFVSRFDAEINFNDITYIKPDKIYVSNIRRLL